MDNMRPVALSIAGSDSGGGAGLQADWRAFQHFRVHGTTVVTAVTAQNPRQVLAIQAVSPEVVRAQLEAVLGAFSVRAVKTGMLFDAAIIAVVAEVLASRHLPLVVDPVMVATSGARLLRDDAVAALSTRLLPLATVITPNLPEAELLLGRRLPDRAAAAGAARELARRHGGQVLLKGGHRTEATACDFFSDGDRLWTLSAPWLAARSTHGTGCSLSAALAAQLALGRAPLEAARNARAYVHASLKSCVQVGGDTWSMAAPEMLSCDEIILSEVTGSQP